MSQSNREGIVVATTAVPGSRRDEYLGRFQQYAEDHGKRVKIFDVGKMLFEQADNIGIYLSPEKVLNTPLPTLNAIRAVVLERIFQDMPELKKEFDAIVINIHAFFYWRHAYIPALDTYYLAKLNPDWYVTFLDDVDSTLRDLKTRPQWQRELFDPELQPQYAVEKILDWQSVETETTRMWADHSEANFFVIPAKARASILYRILFEPWRKIFYFGMPLTMVGDNEEAKKRIDALAEWLHDRVVLIDPRHVEPLSPEHLSHVYMPMYDQVVRRDLHWLIPQCRDGMVALHLPKLFSAGEAHEMREILQTNRNVFLIYPPGPISPFTTYWTDYPIFHSDDDFKKHFAQWLGAEYVDKMTT
jgi:adenylate kinase